MAGIDRREGRALYSRAWEDWEARSMVRPVRATRQFDRDEGWRE